MLFAAVHHIHDLAGFQRVMVGVAVYPQTGAKKHWKASSLWESSEGLTVIDTGKLIDRVCGRYAMNECCELTKLGARQFNRRRRKGEDDDVQDVFEVARSLSIKIVARHDRESRKLHIYRVK